MKSVVILCDGAADRPIPELGGKTAFEAAEHPTLDYIARHGRFGLARTVPEGMPPGSDTANLSIFGYDPKVYYTGRSPLEAASIGIPLNLEDVTYRCNFVMLSAHPADPDAVMSDYSAGEITTEESAQLVEALQPLIGTYTGAELHTGVSYRHCLVFRNAETGAELTPPHDISGRNIVPYLPQGTHAEALLDMMGKSYEILKDHPVNLDRMARGLNPANCMWLWGEGRKPDLTPFSEKFGVTRSGVISAVDLIQGIGICAGMEVIPVEGITGTYHTDFAAKARAAIEGLKNGLDLVYIHIEAPDECGHHGEIHEKVWSIEQIDQKIAVPVLDYLQNCGEAWSLLLTPDHPTPIEVLTHTPDPVPCVLLRSDTEINNGPVRYTEADAAKMGLLTDPACTLMTELVK